MADPELESFKTDIDMRAYASTMGYFLDEKDSWRGTAVMRRADGDKIAITRNSADNHYVFYSFRSDLDHGTIIDFLKHRRNLSLGAIRKELRPWLSAPPTSLPAFAAPLAKTPKDRMKVQAALARMDIAVRHDYLEATRGIPAAILGSARFAGCVRIDARGNAIFPHTDDDGVCGYEIKNDGWTSFSPSGAKGLWLSRELPGDNRLTFFESALDALSYAALFAEPRTIFASIAGRPNTRQPELIRSACAKMPAGSIIVAAMDADAAGREMAEVVRRAVELTGRADLHFESFEPSIGKDWNDQLRRSSPKPWAAEPSVA